MLFLLWALLKTGSFSCYLVILIGGRWCKAQRLFSLRMIYPPVVYTAGLIDQSNKPLITHGVYFRFPPIRHACTAGRRLPYFCLLINTSSHHAVIKPMNQGDASWDSEWPRRLRLDHGRSGEPREPYFKLRCIDMPSRIKITASGGHCKLL